MKLGLLAMEEESIGQLHQVAHWVVKFEIGQVFVWMISSLVMQYLRHRIKYQDNILYSLQTMNINALNYEYVVVS